MLVKDRSLGPSEQIRVVYWRMRDLGCPVNLVASVTAWLNCNHYSMVDVGGRMR
jgi:hypothetical protein